MRHKAFWFSAAVSLLITSEAAADPYRYRTQPERASWVIDANGLFLSRRARRAARSSCPSGIGHASPTPVRPPSPSGRAAKSW